MDAVAHSSRRLRAALDAAMPRLRAMSDERHVRQLLGADWTAHT